MNKLNKIDLILAVIIGEVVAGIMVLIAENLAIEVPAIMYFMPFKNYLLVFSPLLCTAGLVIAHFLSKTISVAYQFAKFMLVGGLNFLIDMGVLNFLVFYTDSPVGPKQSGLKGISFIIAVINSYFWNKLWTFKRTTIERVGKEFFQFFLVSIIGFLINLVVDYAFVNFLSTTAEIPLKSWAQLSAMAAAIVVLFWNFIAYKLVVFKK